MIKREKRAYLPFSFSTHFLKKSNNFVKILYSDVRDLYGFAGARGFVSDWACVDCVVWNGI